MFAKKPPPPKKEEDMSLKELRELKKIREAEEEADRLEQEAREEALVKMTDIQNSLVAEAERDIRIVKSKIDDMKEQYRDFDKEYDFLPRLQKLYRSLARHEHRLSMIRVYPYNSPITTDTSNRNYDWYSEAYHESTNQYEDLRDDNWGNAHNS